MLKRHADMLRYIAGYQEAFGGVSPSVREMAKAIGTGHGVVHQALCQMERSGLIRRLRNRARAIEVLHPVSIPRGPDGEPLFYVKVKHG